MQQQVVEKKAAALQQAFEELEECLADYFNYLPDKVPVDGANKKMEPLIIIDPLKVTKDCLVLGVICACRAVSLRANQGQSAIHKFCMVGVCGHFVGSFAKSLVRYGSMFHCFTFSLCPNWSF